MTAIVNRIPGGARGRVAAGWVGALVLTLLVTQVLLTGTGGRGAPNDVMFRGLVLGASNALIAAGLVVVYRFARIINFSQTVLGAATVMWVLLFVRYTKVPFPIVFIFGVALAGFLGVAVDLMFGRRFAKAPRLVLTVITIAIAGGIGGQAAGLVDKLPFFPAAKERPTFPDLRDLQYSQIRPRLPLAGWRFTVGGLGRPFGFPDVFTIEIAIFSLIALGLFMRYSRAGVAIRSVSENSERAELLGISVGTLGTLSWLIAGLLSGVAGTTQIMQGDLAPLFFTPGTLLLPLAAAVLGRFTNLSRTVYAAVLLSMVSQACNWSLGRRFGLFYVGLAALVLVGLILQRRGLFRTTSGSAGSWQAGEEIRPIPKELLAVTGLRIARWVLIGLVVLAVGVLPFLTTTRVVNLMSVIALVGIVGVSLVVLTGWTGQVSLGHFGIVALGALTCGWLTVHSSVPWFLCVVAGTLASGALALVIGLPALRIRGLYLGVATFAFAVAMGALVGSQDLLGDALPKTVDRPTLFFLNFEDEKSMYFLCLAALAAVILVVTNLRRTRLGRILIGLRDNEANLQSFGVSATRMKLLAFILSGTLAGFAGSLYAIQQRGVNATDYGAPASFAVFVAVMVGGVSSVVGALLGITYLSAARFFFGNNYYVGLLISLGPLVVLFISPAGLLGLLVQLRDGVLRIVAQRRGLVVPSLFADYDPDALERQLIPLREPDAQSGLSAIPAGRRFALASELYAGRGERIIDKMAGPRQTKEEAVLVTATAMAEDVPHTTPILPVQEPVE
jgi:branched-chain amino acid transport system permease protein